MKKSAFISAVLTILIMTMALVAPVEVLTDETSMETSAADSQNSAVYLVTNTNDSGAGSLRQAMIDANGHAGADTILFASNVRGTIVLSSTLPDIADGITIFGPGADLLTVSGNNSNRVLKTISYFPGTLEISGLTIANGYSGSGAGGGIYMSGGTLNLSSCVIRDNTVGYPNIGGGGLYLFGVVTNITDCTISGNQSSVGGAGISNVTTSELHIQNSAITGNVVSSNPVYGGGGIYNVGSIFIMNSTISGNTHSQSGGGIHNRLAGKVYLQNVTITNNSAADGGGISNLVDATEGDTVSLRNTILAGNSATTSAPDFSGTLVSGGCNLIGDVTGAVIVGNTTGNITGLDPNLGPLAYNTGSTKNHALLPGSPAIDAGDNSSSPTSDQRGIPRPQDGDDNGTQICDIGSYELMADDDNDGVSNTEEQGPDGTVTDYDGNTDSTPDNQQSNVASFHTYDGQDYVTLACPAGLELANVRAIENPAPNAPGAPTPEDTPLGFFEFKIVGLGAGDTTTAMLYLPAGVSFGTYFKYGQIPDQTLSHWYEFIYDNTTGAELGGDVITLHFVDGLRGDHDITANGTVMEPGGPGEPLTGISTTSASVLPDKFMLAQNYPNPFNAVTKIPYDLPENCHVELTIYNLLGQKVATVLQGKQTAGHKTVRWDASSFASGIYFYRLQVEGFVYARKMILLK